MIYVAGCSETAVIIYENKCHGLEDVGLKEGKYSHSPIYVRAASAEHYASRILHKSELP